MSFLLGGVNITGRLIGFDKVASCLPGLISDTLKECTTILNNNPWPILGKTVDISEYAIVKQEKSFLTVTKRKT